MKHKGNDLGKRLLQIVAVSLVLLLSACGGNDVASHLSKAHKYQDQGQYRSAVIEYKNVLQKKPDNLEARLGLGKSYLAQGDAADAQSQLQRASRLGAAPDRVALPLARAMISQGKYDQAMQLLSSHKSVLQKQHAAAFDVVRGDAFLGQGKRDEANKAYAQALSLHPGLTSALIGQARLAVSEKDWEKAQDRLDKAISADAKSAEAWVLKGQVAYQQHHLDAAEADYNRVISGKADHGSTPRLVFVARASIADLHIIQNKLETAQNEVDALLKASPRQPLANYLQALIDVRQHRLSDAASHLQVALSGSPKNGQILSLLGAVKLTQGDNAEAQMYLSSAVSLDPSNARTRELLSQAQMRSAPGQARKSRTGKNRSSLKSLQREATQSPDNEGLQMAFAQALLQHGQSSRALAVLNKLPESGNSTGLSRDRLRIAALLRTGKLNEALSAVNHMLKSHPGDPQAYELASDVYMLTNHNDKAQSAVQKALSLAPRSPDLQLKAAIVAFRGGHAQQARDYLLAVHKEAPGNVPALMGLAQVAAVTGKREEEIRWLDQARKTSPGYIPADIVLVRLYVIHKQPRKALTVAKAAVAANPDNGPALNLLAAAQWSAGQKDDAKKSFAKAIQVAPDNMNYRIHLAQVQIASQQYKAASETLHAAIQKQPDYAQAYRLLAFMQLRQHGNSHEALKTAADLGSRPGEKAAATELKGDIFFSQKQYDKAAQAYASVLSGKTAAAYRNVVMKDFDARQRAQIKQPQKPLVDWLENHPADWSTRIVLANWYLHRHELNSAATQYEKVLASQPDNVGTLNNLAWIYSQQHNSRALVLARRAYQQAPDNASVADTLGWIEVGAGRSDKALELLEKAAGEAPKSQTIRYHLAVAQAKSGHRQQARKTLKTLLASKGDFPERQDARELLRKIQEE